MLERDEFSKLVYSLMLSRAVSQRIDTAMFALYQLSLAVLCSFISRFLARLLRGSITHETGRFANILVQGSWKKKSMSWDREMTNSLTGVSVSFGVLSRVGKGERKETKKLDSILLIL